MADRLVSDLSYGTAFSFDWLLRFWPDLHRAFQEILSGEVGYITELAAVTLIVSCLFLAILPIAYQRFFLIYATMIGYLLTVVIFNQFDLTWHLMGIFLCALASSLIQRSVFQPVKRSPLVRCDAIDWWTSRHCCLLAANEPAGTVGSPFHAYTDKSESAGFFNLLKIMARPAALALDSVKTTVN